MTGVGLSISPHDGRMMVDLQREDGVDDAECEVRVLARMAPVVAAGWGIAGVAAGTAWWRLRWEVGAVKEIRIPTTLPVCVRGSCR